MVMNGYNYGILTSRVGISGTTMVIKNIYDQLVNYSIARDFRLYLVNLYLDPLRV
jgi:hypothetical protein